ncbi:MAG: protein pelota [Candidatus Argoarchaeum ethanivorans]|uniref:Protein pelota homolog n=1 Tax=Candidatus Argoarchaeum ethanivorans TaxID=2608793 RepID=A0A8B6SDG0_9EURY|nr:MAG: protein pelota [Candidatus Argoarchaeum ethanivorans]
MKVTKRVLKDFEGEIGLVPESLDDLWHLKYIVEPGDMVFSVTKRKVEAASDKIRPEKMEKQTMRLGVHVERIEFHRFSNRLRIHGVIESGMDTGSYHTLNIEVGTQLSIIKTWQADQIERIKEAVAEAKRPSVIIVTIEEGEASIGVVRQFAVEEFSDIKQSLGKGEGDYRGLFFDEVVNRLSTIAGQADALVLAGPGFTKEDFLKVLKTRVPEIANKTKIEDTASIGVSGFQEVLRRGAVERISESSRLARETQLIENLLLKISTNGAATYGWTYVRRAFDFGAIHTLLIADEYLRCQRESGGTNIDRFLQKVEQNRGKIMVFSTEFEPGKRLVGLGGVAAILRFKID